MRTVMWALFGFVVAAGSAHAELPVSQVEVVKAYPHDFNAFTEGLFYRDGLLYESTGGDQQSTIRAVDLASGRVIRSIVTAPGLFGEGIVDWKDKLVSLTWHGGRGFVWSLSGFHRLGEFHYDGEGWALTKDAHNIIMSDGTPVLRFLDPGTLKVVRTLKVTAEGQPVERLNELEYVKGEILANIWLTNRIARIDPKSGAVKGWIDVSKLATQVGVTDPNAVPNGIAYDKVRDRLFVTGKDWPLLFEVRVPGMH
jgi:glutamine cyclotransferase